MMTKEQHINEFPYFGHYLSHFLRPVPSFLLFAGGPTMETFSKCHSRAKKIAGAAIYSDRRRKWDKRIDQTQTDRQK